MTAHGTGRARRIVALPAAITLPATLPAPAVSAAGAQVIIHTARVTSGARPAGAIGISGWEPTWQAVPGVRWAP
jgi:hypothetical protein